MTSKDCNKCMDRVDRRFLLPRGILKILEIFLNVGAIILVATGRTDVYLKHILRSWVQWGYIHKGYFHGLNYALATACIWLLVTIILFFVFLFRGYRKCCGFVNWINLDCACSILACLMNAVSFVLLCIYCGHWPLEHTIWNERLIAAAVFAILTAILYLADCIVAITTPNPDRGKGGNTNNATFT